MSSLQMMRSPGMMGSGQMMGRSGGAPGETDFVAGTAAVPRLVYVTAGPDLAFHPPSIRVARGETVTFVVTTAGPQEHEFMIGPEGAVAADAEGTPEIQGLGMMISKALTYTFDSSGPFAYACHVAGHYEAGMRGTVVVMG